MPKVSRITDLFVGVCACCPGPSVGMLITGSAKSFGHGLPISKIGDIGLGFCGHIAIVVSGSPTVNVDGSPVARVGDVVTGCVTGVLVTGDPIAEAN